MALAAIALLLPALLGQGAATAQPPQAAADHLTLTIDSITPRAVTGDDEELTITGEVTNVTDESIHQPRVRVQAGIPQRSPDEVATALAGDARTDAQHTGFEEVTDRLEPGQSATVRLSVPLTGGQGGFEFPEAALYPLLVNINGEPEGGDTARLAAFSMVLPVLEVPGADPVEPTAPPRPVSMLWPIASNQRIIAEPVEGDIVLDSDRLADEMRQGGRLRTLVREAPDAEDEAELFDAVCFAIDPEVVATANAMTDGYRVREGPADESTVAGTGAEDAAEWLDALRERVEDGCVVTMPYANSDAGVLAASFPELARSSIDNDQLVADILDTPVVTEAFWPQGPLTQQLLDVLADTGTSTVFAGPDQLTPHGPFTGTATVREPDPPEDTEDTENGENGENGDNAEEPAGEGEVRAVPTDRLISRGFDQHRSDPAGLYTLRTAADIPATATQNGLAALAYRALFDPQAATDPLVLAPSRTWNPDTAELRQAREVIQLLTTRDAIELAPVSRLLAATPVEQADPVGTQTTLRSVLPHGVVNDMETAEAIIGDLESAMSVDAPAQVAPADLLRPLRNGLLRTTAADVRQDQATAEANVANVHSQLEELRGRVSVENPGRTISMASGSSPLPIVIKNDLPVEVTVRIGLHNTIGLRPEPVSDLDMPANSSYTQRIPAEALRAGRFSVDVTLSTPGGTELGDPARIELASTDYGAITVIVTATAAGALLLLAGRRIYQRVRSADAASG
ncbi:DUF6049 family protein [Haloechinothrix sp. LS1_15]|uniref:DUF6049 family protein n=1 Tax=Haloechinothrix sp. LS1_15 TaxID=2652248 RepID=UPI0029480E56|nr:DUF6049 family protein [Haloechinothrix sp. LS1_15]MDV6010992.1 hypothetical protein [Haloechinothrix sp. LS1_15]